MKRFWQILALVMLALIVPASACCLLPQRVANHTCGCCPDGQDHDAPGQPDICPGDTIAHSITPQAVEMPEMQMVELAEVILSWVHLQELTVREAAPLPLQTTAPPELRTTWVFVSRAALPVRAPSELA